MAPARPAQSGGWWDTLLTTVVVALLSAAAVRLGWQRGYTLYYGDAQCHVGIARRVIDSRTPGIDQLGTPWLPLPHLLMLPLVGDDYLWQTGLAGAIPSAVCFVLAAGFLFAAAKSAFSSRAAGRRRRAAGTEPEFAVSAIHAHDRAGVSGLSDGAAVFHGSFPAHAVDGGGDRRGPGCYGGHACAV